ncbi:MAG: hypothetical protein ABEJ28_06375 [Salinigranum sp.]
MSLRSWQLILLGVLVQSGVGVWLLAGGSTTEAASVSGLVVSVLGGGVVVLAVGAGIVVLLVGGILRRVGLGGVAAAVTAVVGGLFLVPGAATPIFWPLPAFFLGASLLSWRERKA